MVAQFQAAKKVIVFDVESVGLHGIGFAYGAVVVDLESRALVEEDVVWCEPRSAWGTEEGLAFVEKNCMPALRARPLGQVPAGVDAQLVRNRFWNFWSNRNDGTALLAADTAWPVEARFLAACVDDMQTRRPQVLTIGHERLPILPLRDVDNERYWKGPYPLIDIATLLAVCPDAAVPRDAALHELPEHDPLADARHSARQLVHALNLLEEPKARHQGQRR